MKDQFELAAGSVIGNQHLRVGKNNQDAYSWKRVEAVASPKAAPYQIAVVCDGCSSSAHSEVGAQLGARLIIQNVQHALSKKDLSLEDEEVWQTIQRSLLIQLQFVAEQLGDDLAQTVQDYLLFTIAGVVITPTSTAVFALGDGVTVVNGQAISLGSFANNAPPYLAYGLLAAGEIEKIPASLKLEVVQILPTDCLQSLLIGSDGVSDLMQVSKQCLPGRLEKVGTIAQFWEDDRYFRNPDQVRRRLALINREVTVRDQQGQRCWRQPGLLPDDTTLIVIRKKEKLC